MLCFRFQVIMTDHCAHGVDEKSDVASIESIIKKHPEMYN